MPSPTATPLQFLRRAQNVMLKMKILIMSVGPLLVTPYGCSLGDLALASAGGQGVDHLQPLFATDAQYDCDDADQRE